MATKLSNKHVTDEQFSDGTTIDGSRLENAMDDIVDAYNKIPESHLRSRYVQSQIVCGYLPQAQKQYSGDEHNNLPWIHMENDADEVIKMKAANPYWEQSLDEAPTDFPLNQERYKGYAEKGGLTEVGTTGRDGIWVWEIPLAFHNPIIIQDIMFIMEGDQSNPGSDYNTYTNDFKYGATGSPPSKSNNEGADDINIVMHVDSPFAPEKRQFCLKEIASHNVQNYSKLFNRYISTIGGTMQNDMEPNLLIQDSAPQNAGIVKAIMFRAEDLNLPISRDSRVRLSLGMPNYLSENIYSTESNGGAPNNQYYSVCLTILEELSDGPLAGGNL